MNSKQTPAPDNSTSPGDGAVVLIGDSKSLRGSLLITNSGQEKISVREAALRLKPNPSQAAVSFGQASFSVVLQPGQSQSVKISLDSDPNIPPGQYEGEMDVNGQTRTVTVFIPETVRLVLSPPTLVIDQGQGTAVHKQVVFSNEGNVPLTIGPIGRVQLGRELLLRRGVHTTVAAAGEKNVQPLEKLFAEFIRDEPKAVFDEAGFLEVRNPAGKVTLQPGEIKMLDLEIRLPEHLETNHRYIGRLPLYTSDLEFIVVPAING